MNLAVDPLKRGLAAFLALCLIVHPVLCDGGQAAEWPSRHSNREVFAAQALSMVFGSAQHDLQSPPQATDSFRRRISGVWRPAQPNAVVAGLIGFAMLSAVGVRQLSFGGSFLSQWAWFVPVSFLIGFSLAAQGQISATGEVRFRKWLGYGVARAPHDILWFGLKRALVQFSAVVAGRFGVFVAVPVAIGVDQLAGFATLYGLTWLAWRTGGFSLADYERNRDEFRETCWVQFKVNALIGVVLYSLSAAYPASADSIPLINIGTSILWAAFLAWRQNYNDRASQTEPSTSDLAKVETENTIRFLIGLGILPDEPLPTHPPVWDNEIAPAQNFDETIVHERLVKKVQRMAKVLDRQLGIHVFSSADLPVLVGGGFRGDAVVIDPEILKGRGVDKDEKAADDFLELFLSTVGTYAQTFGFRGKNYRGERKPSVPVVLFVGPEGISGVVRDLGVFGHAEISLGKGADLEERVIGALQWRFAEIDNKNYSQMRYMLTEAYLDKLLEIAPTPRRDRIAGMKNRARLWVVGWVGAGLAWAGQLHFQKIILQAA